MTKTPTTQEKKETFAEKVKRERISKKAAWSYGEPMRCVYE